MRLKRNDELRHEAVRIALTRLLTRTQSVLLSGGLSQFCRRFRGSGHPQKGANIPAPKSIFATPKIRRKTSLKQWVDFNRFLPYVRPLYDAYRLIEADQV